MKRRDHTPILMYHEIERTGRPLASADPGYVRYAVTEAAFRAQMDRLGESGMRGVSVSQWIDLPVSATPRVVVTFDDGCETDLLVAAPLLLERGFNATCYITVDFLGRPGFLTHAQVRELAATGIEIGCHSMSHAYLSDLDDAALKHEVVDARQRLEALAGTRVRSFSAPGGRYDERLLPLARDAGYDSVTTSDATENPNARPAGLLGRSAIMQHTRLPQFEAIISGADLVARRKRDRVLGTAKSIMGNRLYEKLRSLLLRT